MMSQTALRRFYPSINEHKMAEEEVRRVIDLHSPFTPSVILMLVKYMIICPVHDIAIYLYFHMY
jgi:hypothetical protein